ncbi:MAG: tRNA(Ile)-lysidine synthase [Actinomycetota bacterium]|nr:tRNA(Ile)-lysidine synthase [Actinomycetota bacterium]
MTKPRHAVVGAVRRVLLEYPPRGLALVACSGGPDSIALAAAAADATGPDRIRVGALVVDHGLQDGSARVARRAADTCTHLGLDPVVVVRTEVIGGGGPEASARAARYRALDTEAHRLGAVAVLLGHTADDQAETVLLALGRGSGARALAGMPERRDHYRRPLLDLPRSVVRAAYPDLPTWADPHNADPRFGRSRVRQVVLPILEEQLGPGVAAALARSAGQVRAEVAAVDAWAQILYGQHVTGEASGQVRIDVRPLAGLPAAVVARVVITAATAAGVPGGRLSTEHVTALVALVAHWRGQGPTNLPGGIVAARRSGTVVLTPAHVTSRPEPDKP